MNKKFKFSFSLPVIFALLGFFVVLIMLPMLLF